MKNTLKLDRRLIAVLLTLAAILAIKISIDLLPSQSGKPNTVEPQVSRKGGATSEEKKLAKEKALKEVDMRFKQAVAMLHAKRYEHAVTALRRVLKLAPEMPEAHVNMGFALIGMKEFKAAKDYFNRAIALKDRQVNAYYGLAVALEGMGDLVGAIGAMESYLHLMKGDDKYKTKAQAAIWEWRETVKRQKTLAKSGAKTAPTADKKEN
ncbi:MAG: tetratricopeptide repeat protein [Nitrospinota bacterium]